MPSRTRISALTRGQVARDANHRCCYCRAPEVIGIPMVMEHIIPLAAGGSSNIANLCLACYRCNEFKGARMDVPDPLSGEIVRLFHPRTQKWVEHFAWSKDSLRVIGETACGRATIVALRLNSDRLVQARKLWKLIGLQPPLE